MSSKLKVLQVIPKLGYGGAETGCYDLAHYLHEKNVKSYIVTSGGPLLKYIDKKKSKINKTTCSKQKSHSYFYKLNYFDIYYFIFWDKYCSR